MERDERLPAPGKAKNEERESGACEIVRKPAVVSADSSADVKREPDTVPEVGFASIIETSFSISSLNW